ncbi:roadblock/LC7 domain-containing protein [Streptomyces sp. NPDC001339]|uniref:roadblock/LC7 domain-containing protein n=1 Tax=Streptomyces sp. NPDC001339 TaxID=3364563 RepID=UPI0036BAF43A
MNAQAPTEHEQGQGLSSQARDLHWLLTNLVDEVPGIRSVVVVSSDGLPLLGSDPDGAAAADDSTGTATAEDPGGSATAEYPADGSDTAADRARVATTASRPGGGATPRGAGADLATIVSGLASLTRGAADLMDGGTVKQTMVTMDEGSLFVVSISDGSLLGVHATPDCDMNVIAYHMALFVGRAGHVLTPELRSELRQSMESTQ